MRTLQTTILLLLLISCQQKTDSKSTNSDTLITILKAKNHSEKSVHLVQNCEYKNTVTDLGTGLIIVPPNFEVYEDSLLKKKVLTINMYEDFDKINICSMFFKPDYGIMHFICLKENANSYKVLTGFSDIKYLPKKEKYESITWQKYILKSLGVRRLTEEIDKITSKQSLKTNPTDDSKTLKIPDGYEMFCPLEIKGEFLKVKYDCFYNLDDNPTEGEPCNKYIEKCKNPLTGWLKWKNGNKLLIDIFLMP